MGSDHRVRRKVIAWLNFTVGLLWIYLAIRQFQRNSPVGTDVMIDVVVAILFLTTAFVEFRRLLRNT
jgi:hypothetical protein